MPKKYILKGTLDLIEGKLLYGNVHNPNFEKDISCWPPEQPAAIFAEDGIEEVTVVLKVPTKRLTTLLLELHKLGLH